MKKNVNKKHVGNGGFSLRNKEIMIDIINKWDQQNTDYGNIMNEHIKKFPEHISPEDVYFTTNIINNNLGNLAEYDIASSFSVEGVYNDNPFGGHNFYIGMPNNWLKHLFIKTIKNYGSIDSVINFDRNNWFTYNKISKINSKSNYKFIIDNKCTNDENDILNKISSNELGFIITRHVNTKIANEFWKRSYNFIRKHYPENLIVIIDDNSNQDFITHDKQVYNTIIINSEFNFNPGEYLPYYYLNKYHFFDKAIIVHDSMFINRKLDISIPNQEITDRRKKWKQNKPNYQRGVFAKYAKNVSSASEGAVTS